jgi:hypothetical protein
VIFRGKYMGYKDILENAFETSLAIGQGLLGYALNQLYNGVEKQKGPNLYEEERLKEFKKRLDSGEDQEKVIHDALVKTSGLHEIDNLGEFSDALFELER